MATDRVGSFLVNSVYVGNSSELIKEVPDASIDLVITSPPYNTRMSAVGGLSSTAGSKWPNAELRHGYSDHDDKMPWPQYIQWQRNMIREMWRVIKPTGAIYYNHKTRPFDGKLWTPLALLPGLDGNQYLPGDNHLTDEVTLRQIIIWARAGGVNLSRQFYLPTTEWIMLLAKDEFTLQPNGCTFGDVWRINQEQNNPHPAPFPEKLVSRILESAIGYTPSEQKIVLDAYFGSGTVGVVAQRMGIDYLGFELSEAYAVQARHRIDNSFVAADF